MCLVVLAGLTAPSLAQQGPSTASSTPMLDGSWSLNRELSSAPPGGAPDPASMGRPGGRGGLRGGFGGMGGGTGGGMRGGAQDREELERRRTLMREVLESPERFLITVEDPVVTFTFPDGRVVRYKADGKEERHQYTSGTVKTKTRWETDRLEIETDLGDGMKLTRTYRTTRDPRQLIVTTILPNRSKDLPPISHTYDETLQ